jgi:hypothetical protein
MATIISGSSPSITFSDSTTQATAFANSATQSVNAQNTFGFKNRIINGAMVIDQRNAGASVTLNSGDEKFPVDRFSTYQSTGTGVCTAQQSSTAPTGFINSLKFTTTTANASLSASQRWQVLQQIEGLNTADLGFGTASAKTVTLSFWVYSSLTGTFAGSLCNNAVDRSYVFNYTIASANTWEQKTITITGDTSGTWLTTNGTGIRVYFSLGAGTSYNTTAGTWSSGYFISTSGATSVIGTNGATWYVTGVQLEVGTQATSFDFRDYGRELYLCQRYCQVYGRTAYACIMVAQCYSTTQAYSGYQFVTPMRSAPTLSYSALSDWVLYTSVGSSRTLTSSSISYATTQNGEFLFAIGSTDLVAGNATVFASQNTNATLTLSAEL